jgi:hypothetical protein
MSKFRTFSPPCFYKYIHTRAKIPHPIFLFNLDDLQVSKLDFFNENKPIFHKLKADPYDARREQLEFLIDKFRQKICPKFAYNFFTGHESLQPVNSLLEQLNFQDKEAFDQIKPFRNRAVST